MLSLYGNNSYGFGNLENNTQWNLKQLTPYPLSLKFFFHLYQTNIQIEKVI